MTKAKIGSTRINGIVFDVIVENGYLILRNGSFKYKNWPERLRGFCFEGVFNHYNLRIGIHYPDDIYIAKLLNKLQDDFKYEAINDNGKATEPKEKKELKHWKCDGCIKQCNLLFEQNTDMSKFGCILGIDDHRAMWVLV